MQPVMPVSAVSPGQAQGLGSEKTQGGGGVQLYVMSGTRKRCGALQPNKVLDQIIQRNAPAGDDWRQYVTQATLDRALDSIGEGTAKEMGGDVRGIRFWNLTDTRIEIAAIDSDGTDLVVNGAAAFDPSGTERLALENPVWVFGAMAAPDSKYEIRTSGSEIKEYVVSDDAAQQIFVCDLAIVHTETQPEPEHEAGPLTLDHHPPQGGSGQQQITVYTTVPGGQDMPIYISGRTFKFQVPLGHPRWEPRLISVHACLSLLETIAPHQPPGPLPEFEDFMNKQRSRMFSYNNRYFVLKDGLLKYGKDEHAVTTNLNLKKPPLHVWKTGVKTRPGDPLSFEVVVSVGHEGWAPGETLSLKATRLRSRERFIQCIQDSQAAGAWLEEQWNSSEALKKIAAGNSSDGHFFGLFGKKYESAAKLLLQDVVAKGCQYLMARRIFETANENILARKQNQALQDIEQTCTAFYVHFGDVRHTASCISNFPFCMHFFINAKSMLDRLLAYQVQLKEQFITAKTSVENVEKFLFKTIMDCKGSRGDLAKAFIDCDLDFCTEILQGSRGNTDVVLLFSDIGGASLLDQQRWETFFTMILLETKVASRIDKAHIMLPIHQRQAPFLCTKKTTVPARQLSEIIAKARDDSCFDMVPFDDDTFAHIVTKMYHFPRAVDTLSVNDFFHLATQCGVASEALFDRMCNVITAPPSARAVQGANMQPEFIVGFLRELWIWATSLPVEPGNGLFLKYYQAFISRSLSLSATVHRVYSLLLEDGALNIPQRELAEATLTVVRTKPPDAAAMVALLRQVPSDGHLLRHDNLIADICQLFFDGRRNRHGHGPRAAVISLKTYTQEVTEVLELMQQWNLDVSRWGSKVVAKVASDASTLVGTWGHLGDQGPHRIAVLCSVVRDQFFCTLFNTVNPIGSDDLDQQLNDLADGFNPDAFVDQYQGKRTLSEFLNEWSPDDGAMSPQNGATDSLTHMVWSRLCDRFGTAVAARARRDKLRFLTQLATNGQTQLAQYMGQAQEHRADGQEVTRQLSFAVFYTRVLIAPTLSAAGFTADDRPKWKMLLDSDIIEPITVAIRMFDDYDITGCRSPLARHHLDTMHQVKLAIGCLKEDFESRDITIQEALLLMGVVDVAAGRSALAITVQHVEALIRVHREALDALEQVLSVVRFLGFLNVDGIAEQEQEISQLIGRNETCAIGTFVSASQQYVGHFRTARRSLGVELFDLVLHFQREKSVVFDATVQSLRGIDRVGLDGETCEMEEVKELLEQVNTQLLELLMCTLTTDKLVPILPFLKNCDIPGEIHILRSWKHYAAGGERAAQDIRRCMELLQKVENIAPILDTLRKYEMTCDDDDDAEELRDIARKFAPGEHGMRLNRVEDSCGILDDIFTGLGPTHFRFIETIKDADHLVGFLGKDPVDGKDFYSSEGKRNYAERKRLVDAQIEASASRDHHGRLLNAFEINAMPVCECFATMGRQPLRAVIGTIAGIQRLKDVDDDARTTIDSLCNSIKMANDNIQIIKDWFTRAQVSTFENAVLVMEKVKQTGKVQIELRELIAGDTSFKIRFKQSSEAEDGIEEVLTVDGVDELQRQLTFSLQQQDSTEQAPAADKLKAADGKNSLQVLHLLRSIFDQLQALQASGHPFYQNRTFEYSVKTNDDDRARLKDTERNLSENLSRWESELRQAREEARELQLLTSREMSIIVHLLSEQDRDGSCLHEILQTLLGKDITFSSKADLHRAVHFCIANLLRPIRDVAQPLLDSEGIKKETDEIRKTVLHRRGRAPLRSEQCSAEDAVEYALEALLTLVDRVFKIPGGINTGECGQQYGLKVEKPSDVFAVLLEYVFSNSEPTNSQVLWCSVETTVDDVELFFQRIRSFRRLQFVVCGIGRLTQIARDRVYELQQELHKHQSHANGRHANVTYVTLGSSTAIGSSAAFIKELGIRQPGVPKWPRAGSRSTLASYDQVCALVGDSASGKTHRLKALRTEEENKGKQIQVLALVDEVDSGFCSRKLAALEFRRGSQVGVQSSVFMNVSDVIAKHHSKVDTDRTQFFYDVNRLLFEALVLGYTKQASGSFTLADEHMSVFIEVPARQRGADGELIEDEYLAMLPVLQILRARSEVLDPGPGYSGPGEPDTEYPYEIQISKPAAAMSPQRVATMLRALHTTNQTGRVIDKVVRYDGFQDNGQVELPLVESADECRDIIRAQLTNPEQIQYISRPDVRVRGRKGADGETVEMSEYEYCTEVCAKIAASKLLQTCFLAYLGRRCEYYFRPMGQYTLNGDPRMKLGTTTGRQFVRESIALCDNDHNVDDLGEYLLLGDDYYLTMLRKAHEVSDPDLRRLIEGTDGDINDELFGDLPNFKKMAGQNGAMIMDPVASLDGLDRDEIARRLEKRWPHYIARGLTFGGNAKTGPAKVLKVLNSMNFVMVSDYCFKICHIHERKLAKLPVIIEGETGVGKTYLLDCYANLLASQLRREAREPTRQVVRICAVMKMLCVEIKRFLDALDPPEDAAAAELARATLEAHRWQLENETTAEFGSNVAECEQLPIDAGGADAMLGHWEWLCSIGCPDAAHAPEWAWLSADSRNDLKRLCVSRFVEIVREWRQIPLLDLKGEFDGLDRRPAEHTITSEFEERTRDNVPQSWEPGKLGRTPGSNFDEDVAAWMDDSNERLITESKRVFHAFYTCGSVPLFYRLMVHPGITPEHVQRFLAPIRALAATLDGTAAPGAKEVDVVCFFDEVNTADCQGLFKEILYDRSIGGEPLGRNIFFIAAINPDNKLEAEGDDAHLAFINGNKAQSVKTIHRDVYVVNKMHPMLKALKWNYTKLAEDNLELYIHHKVSSYRDGNRDFSPSTQRLLSQVINASQNFMVTHLGESSVSQRDVQRCFSLIKFFRKHAPQTLKQQGEEKLMQAAVVLAASVAYFFRLPTDIVIGLDKRPILLRDHYLLAVQRVYPNFRRTTQECVSAFVTRENFAIPEGIALNRALQENIFCMVAALETKIPVSIIGLPGSSKTLSFQIVQRNLRGPTLSPTRFCRGFKEIEAKFYQCNEYSTEGEIASVFDRAIERQNDLDLAVGRGEESSKRCVVFLDEASLPDEKQMVLKVLHPYLDEARVAAVVISNVPLDAANANRLIEVHRGVGSDADLEVLAKGCLGLGKLDDDQITEPMRCTVTGLCKGYKAVLQESKETLTEANLESGCAARVCDLDGSSGVWSPPATHRNGAGQLIIPGETPIDGSLAAELNGATATVQGFTGTDKLYSVFISVDERLIEARLPAENLRRIELVKVFKTFHFRDFIYLLRHINRSNATGKPMTSVSPETLLEALECNFGGIQQHEFKVLAEMFFSAIRDELESDFFMPEKLRSPLDIFRKSLIDAKTVASESDTYSELHPRFKLIIDSSEDDSAARLLETVGITFTKVFRMSDFPADNTGLHYARLISDIKMSMERGDTILLIDTDRVHGSFYDLFNQNYDVMEGDKGEKMLFSNVAVGAASHKCRVHKDFQCVVHMREQDLSSKPAPFLSRFEKYRLSIRDFMNAQREAISGMSATKMDFVYERVQSFVDHILPKHFLGFGASTLASLFMSHVHGSSGKLSFHPFSRWTEGNRGVIYDAAKDTDEGQRDVFVFVQALCARLVQLVPPEVATLYMKDGLGSTAGMYRRAYFHVQEHVDFQALMQRLVRFGRTESVSEDCIAAAKKTVVMTRSALDVKRFDSAQLQNYFAPAVADVIDVVRLEKYKSSTEFEDKLDEFVTSGMKEVMVIVADGSLTSTKHLNYVRHLLDQVNLSIPAGGDAALFDELEPEPELEMLGACTVPMKPKQFVLLLHFAPESILTRQDYPTVFLAGWDYIYIDSTASHEAGSAKTLTSILAGQADRDDDGAANDLDVIKLDQLFAESLWRFCSQVDIGHRANAAAPEEMVQACRFYAPDADPGKREQAFKKVLDSPNAAQLRKTIREAFFKKFEGGQVSELLEKFAKDIVSGKELRGLADLCHSNMLKEFTKHCEPFFLALANDFGLVSVGALGERVITAVVAPMLNGISSDDVLTASSLTVTFKTPSCYTLPMYRIVSTRVKRHFDAAVIKVRERIRDDVGDSYLGDVWSDRVRDRLHQALQRDPVCRVFAKPREIAPDLLQQLCSMYAQDAVRNVYLQTDRDDEHVANFVRDWLLCGFDKDDENTDILTHVQMALEPSLDTGANGFKKLNAICQALKKLSGNNDIDDFDRRNRDEFVDRLERHLNKRLWDAMSSLVDDTGQALDMRTWEQQLADWLAAYEFVSHHFPPGQQGTKKEKITWHAMSAVRVIVRTPAVDSRTRRDSVQTAIVGASGQRGEAQLCTVRNLIDETVALFGENNVAKRGLLSEIVIWWTEAAIKHKATEPDFRTCLAVVNGTEAAHGVAIFPAMRSFLLGRLCECVAPGWPNEEKFDGEDVRALNVDERASHVELEAVLCEEMGEDEASPLASLLFNKVVHGYQDAINERPGGINAEDVIGCLQGLAELNERAGRDRLQLIKKQAVEQWLAEAAGRYCSLPFDVHGEDEMANTNSPLGAAMADILATFGAPERRGNLLIFMHAIEQRAGPNHLQELLKKSPFDAAQYPWIAIALDQLALEIDPSGAKYAKQLPFAFSSDALPHPDGMPVEITELYSEFSSCFDQCISAEPPEFQPLADLCADRVAETPARAAHLKMYLLVKVYYDHYSQEQLDKLGQLCDFIGGAQFQCLDANAAERRLLLCVLQPSTAITGYGSDTNELAKVFDINNTDADSLLLRDILVNLAAVTIGAGRDHHLFTFAFTPQQLHGTWGFIAGGTYKIDISHYDCGCKIKEDGAVENDRVSVQAVLMGISTCFGALCWALLCDGEAGLAKLNDQGAQPATGLLSPPAIQGMAEDQGFAGANVFESTCHFVVAHVNMATRFLKLGVLEPQDKFMIFYNQCLSNYFVEATAGAYQSTYAAAQTRAQAETAWEQQVVARALATYPAQEEHIAAVQQQKAKELGDYVDEDRKHIVENILTLKCPRCSQAFLDFQGCFALTCSRADCNCGFCAWCLEDCGGDAHQHVLTCASNPQQGNYYGDDAGFAACNLRRRELKVREYLMPLDEDRRKRVVRRCRVDFEADGVQLAGVLAEYVNDVRDEEDGALLPEIAKAGQAQDVQVTYSAFISALQNGHYTDADTPHILKEFANKRRSLQLMDLVIPIAKLYFFIHENLGHMFSEAESHDMPLQEAVERCVDELVPATLSKKKRRQAKQRILADVKDGIDAVNTFHRVEGGTLQPGACDERNAFDAIGDQTRLLYVLTDPKEDGPNILWNIMSYLVKMQNRLLMYCVDHCSDDPVISMDFAAVEASKLSIFDVLATKGGLLSVTDDKFESVCPAFCSENPVLRTKLMSLAFDFQQCQRFATSLLAGYSIIDEASLCTVFAFKTDRAAVDDETGQLLLQEAFCVAMENVDLLEVRARLGGLTEEALQQCTTALEKYLLSTLRSEPGYNSDDTEDPTLLQLINTTIGDYALAKLGDIADLDCRQALGVVAQYPMRYLRAIALENKKCYSAVTGANIFAAMIPAFRKALNPPSLEDELHQLFDEKVRQLQPNEADNQGRVDLLEHATKFLCTICEDDTSGIENQVLMPLAEYCEIIGYDEESDKLLFTPTGQELPPDVKVENITEVCSVLLGLRQHYAHRALDTAASVPWRELPVDFVEGPEPELEPEPEFETIEQFEPEPEPEPEQDFNLEPINDHLSISDSDSDYDILEEGPDDPAALVPTLSRPEESEEYEEPGGLFESANRMETPEARAQREQEEEEARAREQALANATIEARRLLEDGQGSEEMQELEAAIEEYTEALALENLQDEELIGVLTRRRAKAQAALRERDAARVDMRKYLEEGQRFAADKNYESAVAALQQGVELTQQCHDAHLGKQLHTALKEAQIAQGKQDSARAAADRDFKHAEEAMKKGNYEAAMQMFTGALTHDVNDEARQQQYKTALQLCEKEMASSEFVVADVELTFEESSEIFEEKESSWEPLIPWPTPDEDVAAAFKFVVVAIDAEGTHTEKYTAPPKVCNSVESLHKRVTKHFKKKQVFNTPDTVILLGPGYVALSTHVPATWPPRDLASRAPSPAVEGDYSVQVDNKGKRTYLPLFAAQQATLASIEVELDGKFKGHASNNDPITLQLAEKATWRSVIVICVQHFGMQTLGACCLKCGDEILELGATCGKVPRKLILAPATKQVVVTLVRSEQLGDGQKETKKLSSTGATTGQSAVSISSLLTVVAGFSNMSKLAGCGLVVWSEETQSAHSEGELCEQPEKRQKVGIAKASDVLHLSFSIELAGKAALTSIKPRQCLPDTPIGATSKKVIVEMGLKPAHCLVYVGGAESTDAINLDVTTTAAEMVRSGALSLTICPGVALVGRDALHRLPRGHTLDQLRDQLGLDTSTRLGELQTHVVPSVDELVEASWRKNVQLGAVRRAAVCTVAVTGLHEATKSISFDALATIWHVHRAFKLPESYKLAWKHCILPFATTLEMILQINDDGTEEDAPHTVSLTCTTADTVRLPVLHPQTGPTDVPYAVHVIDPDETNFFVAKAVACMHFGLPHSCVEFGVAVDTSDGSEGIEFDEEESVVSEFVDEYGDDDCTMVLPLIRSKEASEIDVELRTGEGTDVVATKQLLIDTSMPFRRIRSYAKRAFAPESSHLDAEHGCVAIDAATAWMQLIVEEDYQEVDEDDYGEAFEDVGGGDVVQLHVLGELRLNRLEPTDDRVSTEPDLKPFDGTCPTEPGPESMKTEVGPEPEPELDTEIAEGTPPSSRRPENDV